MLNELENFKQAVARVGYSESTDEIAMGLAWTESLFGRGHDLLRFESMGLGVASTDPRKGGVTTVDAPRCPAFGLVPTVLRLSMSENSDPRLTKVCVKQVLGGWIAPYVAFRLAQKLHHAAVFWRPGTSPAETEPPATLILAASAVGGKVRPMMIAPGVPWTDKRRDKLLVGQVPVELTEGLHELLSGFTEETTSALAVTAVPESMGSQFSAFVALEDVIESFGLDGEAPNLLDVERARSVAGRA